MTTARLTYSVDGIEEALKNLNQEIKKTIGKSKKGLIQVAFLIKASSQRKTPIDLGNLRASHYVVWDKGQSGATAFKDGEKSDDGNLRGDHVMAQTIGRSDVGPVGVQMGISARYAIYVHEDLQAAHNVGQAKFFEQAIAEITPATLKIIQQKAKI